MGVLDDFELLPADESIGATEEEELNAATASALEDPFAPVIVDDDVELPFGYTWAFDWDAGRFTRQGVGPARVSGIAALRERCMMAVNSVRFAHKGIFTTEFGVDKPEHDLGAAGVVAEAAAADWQVALRDALLPLDRVADADLTTAYDPLNGVIWVRDLEVTTDEDAVVPFDDFSIPVEG